MSEPPKMPNAVSTAVVVPVIVMPVPPFAGYGNAAGATLMVTPREFSVVHPRTMFDDPPQPRGGSAVNDVMTGVPGSTTLAVNVAVPGPHRPCDVSRTTSVPVTVPALYVNWFPMTVKVEPVDPCVTNVAVTAPTLIGRMPVVVRPMPVTTVEGDGVGGSVGGLTVTRLGCVT